MLRPRRKAYIVNGLLAPEETLSDPSRVLGQIGPSDLHREPRFSAPTSAPPV